MDFIQGKSGNSILGMDVSVSNVSGTTFTFSASDIPSDLAVGDYISIYETAPVVTMIPDEWSPWIQKVAARDILEAIGDDVGAAKMDKYVQREKENLLSISQPRNEGEPIVTVNRRGLVRGNKFSQGRWFIRSV